MLGVLKKEGETRETWKEEERCEVKELRFGNRLPQYSLLYMWNHLSYNSYRDKKERR